MLTLMTLAGAILVTGFAVALLALLSKLVLLPFRLAFGLLKVAIALVIGVELLLLGLPLLLVFALPFLVLGVLAWGVARLVLA
jgi:hypothetical protein